MGDLVSLHDVTEVLRFPFVGELRRVHPDHDQLVGELGLEPFQIRDHVDAVDASVRPEVEEHHLPLERVQGDRMVGVDPIEPFGKLGSIDLARKRFTGVLGGGRGFGPGVGGGGSADASVSGVHAAATRPMARRRANRFMMWISGIGTPHREVEFHR